MAVFPNTVRRTIPRSVHHGRGSQRDHRPHPANLNRPRALRPVASSPSRKIWDDDRPYLRWTLGDQRRHRLCAARGTDVRRGAHRARSPLRDGHRIHRHPHPIVERDRGSDVAGKFWSLEKAFVTPKPRYGRPILVNATGSPAGIDYAAAHSDLVFITSPAGHEIDAALAALPAHNAVINRRG